MWEQGGFEAEYKTEDIFMKQTEENPAKLHEFIKCRIRLVKMKVDNPGMRFRLETNGLTRETLKTAATAESGLEAPEEYFVELSAFEEQNGPAKARFS